MQNPVDHLVELFGSQRAAAAAVGVVESAVSNWRVKGIPDAIKWRLLVICQERSLRLKPEVLGLPRPTPVEAA